MIGFLGGTCNNMYVFAKSLVDTGFAVTFIQDRKDNFPHSQPVWEDVECFFRSGFDYQKIDWDAFEIDHNWVKPSWYFTPSTTTGGEREIFRKSPVFWPIKLAACRYLRKRQDSLAVFNKMRECDFLIVCGIDAITIAMLSGKPYMILPHGSDMRLAIGAETAGIGFNARIFEAIIVYSFKKAVCIGSSLPDASAEVSIREYKRLKNMAVDRVPLPYLPHERLSKAARTEKLKALFKELDIKLMDADIYCFTPSRINFHWKGHDRLFEAINENNENLKIHFIFLGWGDDYGKAMAYVDEYALHSCITVIPIFCSKKMLFRFFEAVDVIIDAFNGSGSYGAALSEAMSFGCPVVTWISEMFDKPGWEAPPVIQARSKEEISEVIVKVSKGEIDLDDWSIKTAAWFNRVHSNEAVKQVVNEKFGHYLDAGRL